MKKQRLMILLIAMIATIMFMFYLTYKEHQRRESNSIEIKKIQCDDKKDCVKLEWQK